MSLLGLTLFLAAPAHRAAAAEPGVVSDLTWYINDVEKTQEIAGLQEIGSKWVRLNVQWKEAEPQKGSYNLWWIAEYTKAVALAQASGQHVIVMVDSAPAWASGSSSSNVPRDPADYAHFMRYLSGTLGLGVDAYEVWNEPNLQRFWSTGPNAAAYTKLLRAAYPAIKAGNPNAKVIFGGVSGNDYPFIEKAYAAGAKGYFDVMATHPYTYCGSTGPSSVRRGSDGRITPDSFTGYREVRASMAKRGDVKPIWFTEFGWNTATGKCNPGAGMWQGGVSEAQQAQYLYQAYKMMEADPYVQVALWYSFRNAYWSKDEDSAEARYGLVDTKFKPKPAYYAFKAYAHGQPAPGTGSGGGTTTPGKTVTTLKMRTRKASGKARARGAVRMRGKVSGLAGLGGVVDLELERSLGHHRWQDLPSYELPLHASRFKKRLGHLAAGRYRARASFAGVEGIAGSKSRFSRFRVG
jgi:hypothetical protein